MGDVGDELLSLFQTMHTRSGGAARSPSGNVDGQFTRQFALATTIRLREALHAAAMKLAPYLAAPLGAVLSLSDRMPLRVPRGEKLTADTIWTLERKVRDTREKRTNHV